MNKKYWKIGILIFTVIAVAATVLLAYGRNTGLDDHFGNFSKTLTSLDSANPSTAPKSPPKVNKKELRKLIKRVKNLDFPECDALKINDQDAYIKCIDNFSRIYDIVESIRDPKLVPELIRLARNSRYDFPAKVQSLGEYHKNEYRDNMCFLRLGAIEALRKIGDKKAIPSFLEIMDETYTKDVGCFDNSSGSYVCDRTSEALLELRPENIASYLIKNIENHEVTTWESCQNPSKIYCAAEASTAYCNMNSLVKLGAEGEQAILEKIKKGNLTTMEQALFLGGASHFPLNDQMLKEIQNFIENNPVDVAYVMIYMIIENAIPENERLYKWFYEQHNYICASDAFGKIINSENAEMLVNIIEGNTYQSNIDHAAISLGNYPRDMLFRISPRLINVIKAGQISNVYVLYDIIGKANNPEVLPELEKMLYDPRFADNVIVNAIAAIKDQRSAEILENISDDKDYINVMLNKLGGEQLSADERNISIRKYSEIQESALRQSLIFNGK